MTKTGEVVEIHCTYDPQTRNAPPADGRKVPGVIHWVSAGHGVPAEVRLYDRLFSIEDPGSEEDFIKYLNPNSLETVTTCYVEQSLKNAEPGSQYQFERLGYFCVDERYRSWQTCFQSCCAVEGFVDEDSRGKVRIKNWLGNKDSNLD